MAATIFDCGAVPHALPNAAQSGDRRKGTGAGRHVFPLVGALVGASGALLHAALLKFLPTSTCALLTLVYFSFITNAFHEDGLADAFDGFGGGWTRERALEIMRDSRVGTFGALALIFLALAKYDFLSSLAPSSLWRWLIVAHTAARWTAMPLCLWLPYAREQGQGKTRRAASELRRVGDRNVDFTCDARIVELAGGGGRRSGRHSRAAPDRMVLPPSNRRRHGRLPWRDQSIDRGRDLFGRRCAVVAVVRGMFADQSQTQPRNPTVGAGFPCPDL